MSLLLALVRVCTHECVTPTIVVAQPKRVLCHFSTELASRNVSAGTQAGRRETHAIRVCKRGEYRLRGSSCCLRELEMKIRWTPELWSPMWWNETPVMRENNAFRAVLILAKGRGHTRLNRVSCLALPCLRSPGACLHPRGIRIYRLCAFILSMGRSAALSSHRSNASLIGTYRASVHGLGIGNCSRLRLQKGTAAQHGVVYVSVR